MKIRLLVGILALFYAQVGFSITTQWWEISSSHVVNMYENHQLDAKVVGIISAKAQGLKNLGCKFSKKHQMWCKVEYREQIGWIESRYLKPFKQEEEDKAPQSLSELSVNCAHINYQVDKLICSNNNLKKRDEQMRLAYEEALNKSLQSEPNEMGELITSQKEWANKRNECWKSENGIENCVTALYERRLNELQIYWKLANIIAANHFSCEDGTTFFLTQYDTGHGAVTIDYAGEKTVLIATPTDNGTKFGHDQRYVWLSAKDAIFVWDQKSMQQCHVEEDL